MTLDSKQVLDVARRAIYTPKSAAFKAKQKVCLDYYEDRQVLTYEKAFKIYEQNKPTNARERVVNIWNSTGNVWNSDYEDVTPEEIEVYSKIGPLISELEMGVAGREIFMARRPVGINVTRKVIETLACTYRQTPQRDWVYPDDTANTDEFIKHFRHVEKEYDIDSLMITLDRYSLLFGWAGVLIEYVQSSDEDGNPAVNLDGVPRIEGHYRFTPLLASNTEIMQDWNGELIALSYYHTLYNPTTGVDQVAVRVFTKDMIYVVIDNKIVQQEENLLGKIPIVWLNDEPYSRNFWGRGYGWELVNLNFMLNQQVAHAELTLLNQTQAMYFLKNLEEDAAKKFSKYPGAFNLITTLTENNGSSIETVAPLAQISMINQTISQTFNIIAITMGVPPGILNVQAPSNSSLAMIENRYALRDFYMLRQSIIKPFEKKFWRMVQDVRSTYESSFYKTSERFDLTMAFPPWPKGGLGDVINEWRWKLIEAPKVGAFVGGAIDYLMQIEGMTRDEAQAKLDANEEEGLRGLKLIQDLAAEATQKTSDINLEAQKQTAEMQADIQKEQQERQLKLQKEAQPSDQTGQVNKNAGGMPASKENK